MSLNSPSGAQTETSELLNPNQVPVDGTFYGTQGFPPFPFLPHPEWNLPVYRVTASNSMFYVFDDRAVDYGLFYQLARELSGPGTLEGDGGPETPIGSNYAEGDFWIEIFGVQNDDATLGLHNVQSGWYGQILSRTNIEDQAWRLGPVSLNDSGTNLLVFEPVPTYGLSRQFYRGVEGFPKVSIERDRYDSQPMEPTNSVPQGGRIGIFNILLSDALSTNLTVYYQISGSAANGVDYANLSGTVTVPQNLRTYPISITPLYDTLVEFEESVTLSLILTNGYVLNPDQASATEWIKDNLTNVFQVVVTNLNNPIGIDYDQPSNSLILSVNWDSGQTNNFVRVYANAGTTVVSNWSGIAGEPDEVKLATPKQTLNGFTNGDLYFASVDKIGLLRADGARSNLTWCVLTNEFVTNAQPLRGGLYLDQSGTFSNHLIAVTSGNDYTSGLLRGVWRVNDQGQPTLLTEIATPHLEGVITLTNDASQWGPWAGKAITGDESLSRIYAISTNGVVTSFDLGINPEDFDLIPQEQDLYCVNLHPGESSAILKLPRQFLANYAGRLLITQAGEDIFGDPALFIVSWNGTGFEVRRISLPSGNGEFEQVTFAPLVLPALNP